MKDKNEISELETISELEKAITQLKERWPAHSVKPQMVQDLDELEERLDELKEKLNKKEMTANE